MKAWSIIWQIAWRNVWRNPRRTILTLLTLVMGCAMIILMNAIAKGGHDQMIEDAVALNTGHIQIHEKGFWENRTIDYAFEPPKALMSYLQHHSNVIGYCQRIIAGGLLSFGNSTRGVIIQGIDPRQEPAVTTIDTKIMNHGRFFTADDTTQALIGIRLAKLIGAGIGDAIAIISQGFDGSIAADRFTIIGLFDSGNPEFDREMVLIPMDQARETFSMMGFIHSLVIRINDLSRVESIKTDIVRQINRTRYPLEVMGWMELMPELIQFIIMDDISAYIFDAILFIVVAFGLLNTIQMSVFERTREFGVMLSIGTQPHQVRSMILLESMILTILGILLGLGLGCGISYYLQIHPLDYSSYADEIGVWGISTVIFPAKTTWMNLAVTSGIMMGLAMIFSWFPARRAGRLNPVTSIRNL